MLALDDLVDFSATLREGGFRVSTQQLMAVQQLLLRLAADGALPERRADLARWLRPVLCTSAAEQRAFDERFGRWLAQRFPSEEAAPPPPPAPAPPLLRPSRWRQRAAGLLAWAALALLAWFGWQDGRPRSLEGTLVAGGQPVAGAVVSAPAASAISDAGGRFVITGLRAHRLPITLKARDSAASAAREGTAEAGGELAARRRRLYLGAGLDSRLPAVRIELAAPAPEPPSGPIPGLTPSIETAGLSELQRFDLSGALRDARWTERIDGTGVLLAAIPLLLFIGWLLVWFKRRPALKRIASRTPPQLREVHVPGHVRALLPSLPLRRLAQELRRRRLVASSELQVEPTVLATLRRAGQFTPVRGSRAEPDYLALVDRAGLADHQALLAAEVVAELARSDVLIERYDFARDPRLLRGREALARGRGAAPRAVQAIDLAELHERHPEHRVLVFGDGAGCFDGFTGEPTAATLILAAWPLAVLLTPLPLERWGRREWALQRLGIPVLPLDATGLVVLMGLVAGLGAASPGTEPPRSDSAPLHERQPRRWLERDTPPAETLEPLIEGLRSALGPRGLAWLAACAAYPEVHWGITLRLGSALVREPAEFERLLPRLARLVWLREAYLPDWLRERLLQELAPGDELLARATLHAMLEQVARSGAELPLRIALGTPDTGLPWWRRALQALRARSDAQRAEQLLRGSPPDSPLRDHVFLRFLSGVSMRPLDPRAPAALLAALRARRGSQPVLRGLAAFAASAALAWFWPLWHFGESLSLIDPPRFAADGRSALVVTHRQLAPAGGEDGLRLASQAFVLRLDGAQRTLDAFGAASRWQLAAPGGGYVVAEQDGALVLRRAASVNGIATVATQPLQGSALAAPLLFPAAGFSAGDALFALREDSGVRVWRSSDGTPLHTLGGADWSSELMALGINPLALPSLDIGAARKEPVLKALRWSLTLTATWSATGDARLVTSGGPAFKTFTVTLPDSTALHEMAFTPDGNRVAAIDGAGRVRLWAAPAGEPIGAVVTTQPTSCCAAALAFSPDAQLLATTGGRELALWTVPGAQAAPSARRSIALVVGSDYKGSQSPLQAGVRDARAAATLLRERFGFEVTLLEDPARGALVDALGKVTASAGPADRLLVYLSGHGTRDAGDRFSFVATPAGKAFDSQDFVAGDEITRRLAAARAREVLVLGDTSAVNLLAKAAPAPVAPPAAAVRVLISSYTQGEPNEGPNGSPFGRALEATLRSSGPGLTSATLLAELDRRMQADAGAGGQRPTLLRLPAAGDRGGDFTFPAPLTPAVADRTPVTMIALSQLASRGGAAALQPFDKRLLAIGDDWFFGSARTSPPLLSALRFVPSTVVVYNPVSQSLEPAPLSSAAVQTALSGPTRYDAILLSFGLSELVAAAADPKNPIVRPRIEGGGVSRAGAYNASAAAEFKASLQRRLREFQALQQRGPHKGVPVFVHTYDRPQPRPAGASGAGPWLQPAFEAARIPADERVPTANYLIDLLADALQGMPGITLIEWDPLESTCRHASLSIL